MSRIQRDRTIGNLLPVALCLENIAFYIGSKRNEVKDSELVELEKYGENCVRIITDGLQLLPPYYRNSARAMLKATTKAIYYGYFAKQKFDTGKVFMLMNGWVRQLAESDLIDMLDQSFIDMIETLQADVERGLDGELEDEGITAESVELRYLSAQKHIRKVHTIAMDADLYIPTTITRIERQPISAQTV